MRSRRARIAALALGAPVALAALALALLPSLVRLDRFRDLLAARLSRAIGHEVSLGALRLHAWGRLGAEVRGLRVADRSGEAPVVVAERAWIGLEWGALLRGRLHVSAAEVERPRVRVARRADGHWNVEHLGLAVAAARPGPAGRPGGGASGAGRGLAVVLRSVTVREGAVSVEPGGGMPSLRLDGVAAEVRQEGANAPLLVRASGRTAEGLRGRFELSGEVRADGPGSDGPGVAATLKLSEAEIAPLLGAMGLLGSGPSPAGEWHGPIALEVSTRGGVERLGFRVGADLGGVAFSLPGRLRKAAGEPATLAAEGRLEGSAVAVERFAITLRDLRVEGKALAGPHATDPVRFEARFPRLDLGQLVARPAGGAAARGGAAASGTGGQGRAVPTSGPRRARATAAAPRPGGGAPGGPAIEGTLRADEVAWDSLRLADARAQVGYRQGRLKATAIHAGVGGGSLEAEAEIDLRGREPAVWLEARLAGVRAEAVTAPLGAGAWQVAGTMDLRSRLAWSGWPDEAGLAAVRGEGSLRVTGGRLAGSRPLDRLSELLAPFLPAAGLGDRLEAFDALEGRFLLEGGTLRTEDLALRQGSGEVRVAGRLDLITTALDVDVTARLKRATIEAKVTGTTASPVVTPKLTRLERRIEAEVDKAMRGARGQRVRDLLRGLLPGGREAPR
jgi:AsmA protein